MIAVHVDASQDFCNGQGNCLKDWEIEISLKIWKTKLWQLPFSFDISFDLHNAIVYQFSVRRKRWSLGRVHKKYRLLPNCTLFRGLQLLFDSHDKKIKQAMMDETYHVRFSINFLQKIYVNLILSWMQSGKFCSYQFIWSLAC